MFETLEVTTPLMPVDKPRYLMGVGKPADLVGGVARGIDMFDCVLPTRSGRTGQGFTRRGPINLKMRVTLKTRAHLMQNAAVRLVRITAVLIFIICLKPTRCCR